MKSPVIVLGAGGHAKVLINTLQLCSTEIVGVTDSDPMMLGKKILGVEVIGSDDILRSYHPDRIQLVNALGSVVQPAARRQLFHKWSQLGFAFANVVHPSAVIAQDVRIGAGTQIMAGAVVQPGVLLGENVIINTRASVDHDCVIGDHAHVAPGVVLSGGVKIECGTHVGTGATIIHGISVGCDCLIAAGAVVTKNINDKTKVRGVPAKEFL